MKIIQLSKRLNNDESGGNRNHDTFIDLIYTIDWKELLFVDDIEIDFIDKRDNQMVPLRLFARTNETRYWIKQLGPYYGKYGLKVGDEIILERRILDNGEDEYYIDNLKYDTIIFQRKSFYDEEKMEQIKGFELLCGDLDITTINEKYDDLSIVDMGEFRRNQTGRYYFKCYNILYEDEDLLEKYGYQKMVEIKFINNKAYVNLINRVVVCEMEV